MGVVIPWRCKSWRLTQWLIEACGLGRGVEEKSNMEYTLCMRDHVVCR